MHEPLPLTHKEGMGVGDGEIIHRLRRGDKHHGADDAEGAIDLTHLAAGLQLAGRHPLAFSRVERVFRRRLDDLAVDAQVDHHGVLVHPDGDNGVGVL